MAINHYTSIALTRAVSDMGSAQKVSRIRAQFPDNDEITMGEQLEYGYDSDNPHILVVRKQHEGSSPIAFQTGTLKTLTFPKYRPSATLKEADARKLDPSLNVYTGRQTDPNANLSAKIAKQLEKMNRYIETSHLANCAAGLRTGSVTFKFEDATTNTMAYGYTTGTAVDSTIKTALSGTTAPTAIWTHANALPIDNIELLAANIRKTSQYGGPLDVLMGAAAWDAFRKHSTVTTVLDNRRVEAGQIMYNENMEYKASFGGFNIFLIDFSYQLTSTWTAAWDTNTIAVVPREPGDWFSTEYGAPYEIPEGTNDATFIPVKKFSKVVTEPDPPVQKIILESRLVPVVKNPLCLRVQTVIS